MRKVRVAPKGMGLNDFVAQQEGFFAEEGIEVEWDIKTSVERSRAGRISTTSRARRTSPTPRATRARSSAPACGAASPTPRPAWGASCPTATASRLGRSSVRPDSRIRRQDLLRTCRSRSACAPAATSTFRSGSKIPAAREHQGREHRRLRRAAQGAARQGSGGGEPAAAADRHGAPARPADGDEDEFHTRGGFPRARRSRTCAPICAVRPGGESLNSNLQKYLPRWESASAGIHGHPTNGTTRSSRAASASC